MSEQNDASASDSTVGRPVIASHAAPEQARDRSSARYGRKRSLQLTETVAAVVRQRAVLPNPPSLLVCATEISGDVRGACLATELQRLAPQLRLYGLGGERMQRAGVDVRIDITDRGTVGWFDHWRDLPHYLSALRFWRRQIRDQPPFAAMVIDAPGISFPFARVARSAGVPVIYFVAPQTWLWNPHGAVERLRACADIVIPTLDAEAEIYARAGLPVIYEGHPALDDLIQACTDRVPGRRPADGAAVGLVPGSRRHAIRRLLPVMLDALDLVEQRVGLGEVLVSVAARPLRSAVDSCLRGRPRRVRVVEQDLWAVLTASDVVLASAGGNLLDAAFAGVPVVASYRLDSLSYLAAKHVMRLHRRLAAFALPNLIAGDRIVPELIQRDATAARLADAAVRLLTDQRARDAMRSGYARVRAALGTPGVNARLAGRLLTRLGLSSPGTRVPAD
jgi:lipid-A-disaccharide synthase